MGFAMLKGWLAQTGFAFTAIEPNPVLRAQVTALGVDTHSAPDSLPADFLADAVVIATKPDVVLAAAASIKEFVRPTGLVLSVAAGILIDDIQRQLATSTDVIRCMPNLPALIGEGMIVCCTTTPTSTGNLALAELLLSACGQVAFIETEEQMDAVTAVSGSGPAYVFHLLEALCAAAVSLGLEEGLAMRLAKQTVLGSIKMATSSDDSPARLREQVTSPKGTTAAALEVLMDPDSGLTALIKKAAQAASRRSIELRTA
jgi:pyrroline-5-carboxylate reductase